VSGVTLTPRSIAAFIFLALVWGSTWLVIKDQISAVPAAWSVVWRFILAATAMAAFALLRRERMRLTGREMAVAIAMGFFQFSLNFQLIYKSEHYLTSGLVAVVFALMIVPNAILARLVLGAALTFPLYSQLIRDWGPGPAAYNGVAVPVVAMILSTLFEGYQWSLLAGGGAVLAMAGLLVALSGRK
jgi:drug/metabolite transporter (DMT)-like permease